MDKFGSNRTLPSPYHTLSSKIDEKGNTLVLFSPRLPLLDYDIAVHIFSFLLPEELAMCARINKSMSNAAIDAGLWQTFCERDKIPCGPGIELLWERCHGDRGRWWKEIYTEWAVAQQNWRTGIHKKRLLKLADTDDAITW